MTLSKTLNISTFRDISSFLLSMLIELMDMKININYVSNANEAHNNLQNGQYDIVLMSYDDTLSMFFEKGYKEIRAFMPIHGGILDLCSYMNYIDFSNNKNRIGIDTDTGYARVLKKYLLDNFANEYTNLNWVYAGATNIRYQKLLNHEIDFTLLNPPFSCINKVNAINRMYNFIGEYQGLVANINIQSLDTLNNSLLASFINKYYDMITYIKSNQQNTINMLQNFYNINAQEASLVYHRLWQEDGLQTRFDIKKLKNTEDIFSDNTAISIPTSREWIYEM